MMISNTCMVGEPRPKKVDDYDAKMLAQMWMNELPRRSPRRDLDMKYSCSSEMFDPVFLDFYSEEHLAARAKRLYTLRVNERLSGDDKDQIILAAPNGILWEITFRLPTGRPAKVQD